MDYINRARPEASTLRSGKIIILSYLLDYVVIVALFFAVSALNFIKPFNQHFALQNYTLQYPYAKHERVPVTLLYICAVVAPAGIIGVWTLAIDPLLERRRAKKAGRSRDKYIKSLWELNCGILGLLLANTAAYVITGVLKNAIGKPRPDLIDRCQPDIPQDQFMSPVFGLSDSSICTQTDESILHDGFRSFPSGHSSSSFAGLFFLSLYLAGKLHFLDHQGSIWKVFVVLIPSLGAALIAGSRIMDARHHPFDVITGSLLGIASAYVAYRQYFPPVTAFGQLGRAYTERRHHGPTGPEPVRTVHRNLPSISFDPAEPEMGQSLIHGMEGTGKQQYTSLAGTSPHKPGSPIVTPVPLRQRAISNPSNPRTSLGPDIGLNAGDPSQRWSPASSWTGHQDSMYRRPSADGPLGSDGHGTSGAWAGSMHHPHPGLTDIDALRSNEFPGSPPLDGPSAPIELDPLPIPVKRLRQDQDIPTHKSTHPDQDIDVEQLPQSSLQPMPERQHEYVPTVGIPSAMERALRLSRQGFIDQAPPSAASVEPVSKPGTAIGASKGQQAPSIRPVASESEDQFPSSAVEPSGTSRYSFEEGGERIVHPAFRSQG